MSSDQQILDLVGDVGMSPDDIVAALPNRKELIVRMRIGYLISQGKASMVDGLLVAGGAPAPKKPRKERQPKVAKPTPPPEPFDCARWLSGGVCITGATVLDNGQVAIEPADAVRMARFILGLPQEVANER